MNKGRDTAFKMTVIVTGNDLHESSLGQMTFMLVTKITIPLVRSEQQDSYGIRNANLIRSLENTSAAYIPRSFKPILKSLSDGRPGKTSPDIKIKLSIS